MQPNLYVIAGPNGIGKTTSSFDLIPSGIPIINSDEIAAAVRLAGLVTVNAQEYGNREAIAMINDHIERRNSFAMETNLADIDTWKFLIEIQKSGYNLNLIYLSCSDLSILNSRIDQRVLAGEHYVRPDIVEERYINGLNLLNHYFSIPDVLYLIDNDKPLTEIAVIQKGTVYKRVPELPKWVNHHLGHHFSQHQNQDITKAGDLNSIDAVKDLYQKMRDKKGKRNHL